MRRRAGWMIALAIMVVLIAGIPFLQTYPRDSPSRNVRAVASTSDADVTGYVPRRSVHTPDHSTEAFVEQGTHSSEIGNSYEFTKTCYRYKRLETFYAAKSKDPNSPLANPAEFAKLPPEQQAYARQVMTFLEQQAAVCAPWASAVPQTEANIRMYAAARAAASRGDDDAATCYVAAAWQSPDESQPEYDVIADGYAKDVPRLVYRALAAGSWGIVNAAAGNLGEQHGLSTRSGLTPSNKYLVARLSQLGAADSASAAQYGSFAAAQAGSLSSAQVVDLDRQASRLYAERFGRSQYVQQDILDKCVN